MSAKRVPSRPSIGGVVKMKIVKGDLVMLRRGKEKHKRGVVKAVFPREGMALVEGLNVVKRHQKQGQPGSAAGIIEKEAPIPLSVLMVVDPKTNLPTRVRRVRIGERSERVAVRGGAVLPSPVKG